MIESFHNPDQVTSPDKFEEDVILEQSLRPSRFDEFVGQEHILTPGQPLRLAIERDTLMSCIFWGPPGCGKTTLAHIIAQCTKSYFAHVNASTTGVPELRKQVAQAEERLKFHGQRTLTVW